MSDQSFLTGPGGLDVHNGIYFCPFAGPVAPVLPQFPYPASQSCSFSLVALGVFLFNILNTLAQRVKTKWDNRSRAKQSQKPQRCAKCGALPETPAGLLIGDVSFLKGVSYDMSKTGRKESWPCPQLFTPRKSRSRGTGVRSGSLK